MVSFFIFVFMFKRLTTLLLVLVFLVPATGFRLDTHLCGMQLADITINGFNELSCSCEDFVIEAECENEAGGCCENQSRFYKIHDHFRSSHNPSSESREDIITIEYLNLGRYLCVLHPPLSKGYNIYIPDLTDPPQPEKFCVFRI
jgi:hypothetical protein